MTRRLRDLAALALVTVTACGSASQPSMADTRFVAQMIPHHEVGMELIEIATTRADDVRLRRLVFEMSGYHHDDMVDLSRMAFEWGVAESTSFPGEIPEGTLALLRSATGPEFDVAWLDAMIDHHEGALVIAGTAATAAEDDEVTDMAERTHRTQSAEIFEMETLLSTLCATVVSELPEASCS